MIPWADSGASSILAGGASFSFGSQTCSSAPVDGSLFIAGGSGAIGTVAIQLARQRGWHVAASASKPNHDYMLSLGAHKVVDYGNPHWREQILEWMPNGVDAVLAVQPGTSAESLPVVKDGGTLVSISGDAHISERGIHITGSPIKWTFSMIWCNSWSRSPQGRFIWSLSRFIRLQMPWLPWRKYRPGGLEANSCSDESKAHGRGTMRIQEGAALPNSQPVRVIYNSLPRI